MLFASAASTLAFSSAGIHGEVGSSGVGANSIVRSKSKYNRKRRLRLIPSCLEIPQSLPGLRKTQGCATRFDRQFPALAYPCRRLCRPVSPMSRSVGAQSRLPARPAALPDTAAPSDARRLLVAPQCRSSPHEHSPARPQPRNSWACYTGSGSPALEKLQGADPSTLMGNPGVGETAADDHCGLNGSRATRTASCAFMFIQSGDDNFRILLHCQYRELAAASACGLRQTDKECSRERTNSRLIAPW